MALATTLQPLLSASDDGLRDYLASDKAAKLLADLDSFFSRATVLQSRRNEENEVAATRALQQETRSVFSFYMRLVDAPSLLEVAASRGVLHVTRVVPFCQVYAPKNADAVRELLDTMESSLPAFQTTLNALRLVFIQVKRKLGEGLQWRELHAAVNLDKRGQVVDLIHQCLELSLSLLGMASTSPVTDALLLNGKDPEDELAEQATSMLYALLRCYEADLPRLQRHVATFEDKLQQREMPVIAETRHALLLVLGRCIDLLMKKQESSEAAEEALLAGLHGLSNGCEDEEADHGSYMSDLWYLCGYKDTLAAFFERCELDSESFSYLDMVIEGLPRRRVLPTMLVDDMEAENKASVALSADAKEWKAPASSSAVMEETEETKAEAPGTGGLDSMVHQVKDFFPDLGEGYIELCLLNSGLQVEVVINFLLESNPPPVLLEVSQDLQRSDPEFQRLEAVITGKSASTPAVVEEKPKKLDPSRVWVGKKMQEKHYDPQIAKKDQQLAEKMKQIAVMYEEEDEYGSSLAGGGDDAGAVGTLDEYDDDYNDEFEDYVPFSVHDNGSSEDQDAVREQNRRMRAKEEKDAFWEHMKNPNRRLADDGDEDDDEEEKQEGKAGEQKQPAPPSAARPSASSSAGPKQPSSRRKDKNPTNTESKTGEGPTPQQMQRARARKDKNKAKVANHNRKDRALKKMG
ncbi:hypothetical protein BBJ28_00007422 [Nothophytophthora sp. Chile5]|nr:hypothetical protein BBJ28_00007422 [Nothophytophthora sp. Chile5]